VADLGLSREIVTGVDVYQAKDSMFPVKWSPPEVIEYRQFTHKSDVWSFGVTLWELWSFGKVPYSSMSNSETVAAVLKGERLDQPLDCPGSIFKLISSCWAADPSARPSFQYLHEQLTHIVKVYQIEEVVPEETPKEFVSFAYNNDEAPMLYN